MSTEDQRSTNPANPKVMRFHTEHLDRLSGLSLPQFVSDPALTTLAARASAVPGRDHSTNPNPYALQADTLSVLLGLLDLTSPRSIVEFGSGASTKLFARWAAQHGRSVTSVEHDRHWIEEIRRQLEPLQSRAVRMVHAPLRPKRAGLRQFMTYGVLTDLLDDVQRADLLLLDGPHMSGREIVLYFVLSHCQPGAVIVVDDLRHYAVFEMIAGLSPRIAKCFAATTIDENSHGLLVLKCLSTPGVARAPTGSAKAVLRSYWRCLKDLREHGTGD